jgi:hypothetical protein
MVDGEQSSAANIKQNTRTDLPVAQESEREEQQYLTRVNSQTSSLNRFSLGSLLMITALVAMICWGFSVHHVLGSIIILILAPALARTMVIARYYGHDKIATGNVDRIMEFVDSVGAVIIAAMGAGLFGYAAGLVAVFPGMLFGQIWERGEYPGLRTGWIVGWITFSVVACTVSFLIILASMPVPGRIPRRERYFLGIAVVASFGVAFLLLFNKVLFIQF